MRTEKVGGRRIRCWDNGGTTADRYTVAWPAPGARQGDAAECVQMGAVPFFLGGLGTHGRCLTGRRLGRRIAFADLPRRCRDLVERECRKGAR